MDDISHIIDTLNDAQRDAVTTEDQHALILAGAGSGKTKVLVHRIAWLTQVMGFSSYNILAVTFTNKAAAEMRGRIEALVGNQSQGLTMGTFHGIAYRLLRQHFQEAGLPQSFQILDSDDQKRVIKRLLKTMELDEQQWPHRQVQAFINGEKEEGRRPQHIDPGHNPFVKRMVQIYQAYEAQCKKAGLVDFAELLLRAHELWLKHPHLLAHYQSRFRHILVDEFQDTNTLQYAWLRVLAGATGKLFIVGDDDQSIYGWRGAKIENIRQFSQDFANVKTVRLEQNYRSTGTILKAANALIAHNQERMGKTLWSAGDDGNPIKIYEAFNDLDEAQYVCNQVNQWVKEGGERSDAAVLYRSNAQSRLIEQALLQAKIPYRVYGGLRFYDRAEVKDVLAYLRLILNRQDDAAFERIYNHPPRGIGAKTADMIRDIAKMEGVSLWNAMESLLEQGLTARAQTSLMSFKTLIESLEESGEGQELKDQTMQVISRSGLQLHFEKDTSEQGQSRLENLDELINATSVFKTPQSAIEDSLGDVAYASPLAEFLAQAALEAGEQQADKWESCVQLMTLHSAKGLEFPLVFMVGVEEGLFPSQQSTDDAYKLEEERRLAYVGITRAEKQLMITFANRRRMHGSEFYPQPSRFIKEIPNDCVDFVRLTGSARPSSGGQTSGWNETKLNDALAQQTGFALGDRVFHQKFGEGTVLATEGAGEHARIQVNFKAAGSKWLVVGFAKLERL
ncbi:DNA helicase II [Thiosulfativibrio zosterae]|uniref:DNA 3'-5' helicase n=1 Tax=Thiosulfativibrio zosterae TaxID=2675053 RepID=A0A6F8PQN9_9GAMM|nr:DNA helicase II [Thiosulfativibrio zosterae]BBP44347.1 DNA helicase [Thiosulfativibrio zosterae]